MRERDRKVRAEGEQTIKSSAYFQLDKAEFDRRWPAGHEEAVASEGEISAGSSAILNFDQEVGVEIDDDQLSLVATTPIGYVSLSVDLAETGTSVRIIEWAVRRLNRFKAALEALT